MPYSDDDSEDQKKKKPSPAPTAAPVTAKTNRPVDLYGQYDYDKRDAADKAASAATDAEAKKKQLTATAEKAKSSQSSPPPKAADYPDMASYGDAMREWRQKENEKASKQKEALAK